jgi:3-deoxy-manno-octulosonate cytidylyltransferase (CMP-KDO synthetase)
MRHEGGVLCLIPARMGSTRLPGKALIQIAGLPLIVRTYRRALEIGGADWVYVATPDREIEDVCQSFGVNCVRTPLVRTGTDCVAEAAMRLPLVPASEVGVIVNCQGDEPLIPKDAIRLTAAWVRLTDHEVTTGVCRITDEADADRPSVGKVVLSRESRVLYMSRCRIPWGAPPAPLWTQVCVYGFRPKDLRLFASMQTGRLEKAEGIELLRWIENDRPLRGVEMPAGSRHAVDVPEDVDRVTAAVLAAERKECPHV